MIDLMTKAYNGNTDVDLINSAHPGHLFEEEIQSQHHFVDRHKKQRDTIV